jgi:hypothetical protein
MQAEDHCQCTLSQADVTAREAQRNTSLSAVFKYLLETLPGISRASLAFPARGTYPAGPQSAPSTSPPSPNRI